MGAPNYYQGGGRTGGGNFSMWSSPSRVAQNQRLQASVNWKKGGLLGLGIGPDIDLGVGKTIKGLGAGLMGLGHLAGSALTPSINGWDPVEGPGSNEAANMSAGILSSLAGTATRWSPQALASTAADGIVNAVTGGDRNSMQDLRQTVGENLERWPGDATAEQLTPLSIGDSLDEYGLAGVIVEDVGNVALAGAGITAPAKAASLASRMGAAGARTAKFTTAADALATRSIMYGQKAAALEAVPGVASMKHPYRTSARSFREAAMKPAAQRILASQGITDVPAHLAPIEWLAADLPDNGVNYQAVTRDVDEMAANAAEYRAAPVDDPDAGRFYDALAKETAEQYRHVTKDLGVKISFVDEAEPYATHEEMVKDVRENKHLKVAKTEEGAHPRLTPEQNDQFRAVHDLYGHAATGRDFARGGEEAAYIAHSGMYGDDARRALASETRGQNAMLIETGEFADQKAFPLSEAGADAGPAIARHQQAAPRFGDKVLARMELEVRGREATRIQRQEIRMAEAERQAVLHSPAIVAAVEVAQRELIDVAQANGQTISRKQASLIVGEELDLRLTGGSLAEDIALEGGMTPDQVAKAGVRHNPVPDELRTPEFEAAVKVALDELVKADELLLQQLDAGRPGKVKVDGDAPKQTKRQRQKLAQAKKKIKRASSEVQARKIARETGSREKYAAGLKDRLGRLAERARKVEEDMTGAVARFDNTRGALTPRAWRKAGAMEQSAVDVHARTLAALQASGGKVGGASYDPHAGRFIEPGKDSGHAVGLLPGTALEIPLDQFTPSSIETVIRAYQDVFAEPGTVVGTWVEKGKVYIDVSEIVADVDDAMIRGAARGQLATFDVAADATVDGILQGRPDIAQQFLTRNRNLKRIRGQLRDLLDKTQLSAADIDVFTDFAMREAVSAFDRGLVKHPDEFFRKYLHRIEFATNASPNQAALRSMFLDRTPGMALWDEMTPVVHDLAKVRGWYHRSSTIVKELFEGQEVTLLDGSKIDAADLMFQLLAATSFRADPRSNITRALDIFQKYDDLPLGDFEAIKAAMLKVTKGTATMEEAFKAMSTTGLKDRLSGLGLVRQYSAEILSGHTIDKWTPESLTDASRGFGGGSMPDRQQALDWIGENTPDLIERIGEDKAIREFYARDHRAKIMNFMENLRDPDTSLMVTMDSRMEQLFGVDFNAPGTWLEYSEIVRDMADEITAVTGEKIMPHEVQAVMWVFAKEEVERLTRGHFNAKAFEAQDILASGKGIDPGKDPISDWLDEIAQPYREAGQRQEHQRQIMRTKAEAPEADAPKRPVEFTSSPLDYGEGPNKSLRLVIRDPEATRTGQTQVVDPTDPTVVGYIDYTPKADGSPYIEFMSSRDDYRGQGLQRQLLERLYEVSKGGVDFGPIEHPAVEVLRRDMASKYRSRKTPGKPAKGIKKAADDYVAQRDAPKRGTVSEETLIYRPEGPIARDARIKVITNQRAKWEIVRAQINEHVANRDIEAAQRVLTEYQTKTTNQAARYGGLTDDSGGADFMALWLDPAYHSEGYVKNADALVRLKTPIGQRKGNTYAQAAQDRLLGEFIPMSDGTRGVIRIFEDGNLATLVHESGHLLRQILPDAEVRMIEGIYGPGVKHGDNKWTRASQERLANDLLNYMRSGKAPKGLETAFAKVKTSLKEIWDMVQGTFLHRRVHPEVRDLFDDWFNPAEQPLVTEAIPGRPDVVPETGTLPQRVLRKPALGGAATTNDFYQAGRKGQKAIADVERLAARKRTLDASATQAQKALEDVEHVLETGKVPSRLEADAMIADARRIEDKVAEQLKDPSRSNTPTNWTPFLDAARSLAKEAAKDPALATLLTEIPQTLADIQALALEKGFNPAHVREFSPEQVRRLVNGTMRLGKQGGLLEDAAGTRSPRSGVASRAGAVEHSIEAWVAASVEVIQETRTNHVVDWVEKSAARSIGHGEIIPDGWVAWDPLRTQLLTGEVVSEGTIKAIASKGATKIIPKAVHNTLMKATREYDHAIFRGINRITTPWRTLVLTLSPGWYVRNISGNVIMATAEGASLRDWQAAWKSYRNKDIMGGFADVPQVKGNSLADEAGQLADSSVLPRKNIGQAMNEDGKIRGVLRHVSQRMLRVNEVVDEFSRAAVYHRGRRLNMPHEEAWHRASTAMVDYGNLSNFERRVVRSMIPFYSWQKGILKVTMNQFIDHPARTRLLMAMGEMHAEYVADQMGLEADDIPDYYKHLIGKRNLRGYNPFMDAGDLLGVEGITRSMNPFVELAVRKGLGAPRFADPDNKRVDPFGFVQNDVDVPSEMTEMLTQSPGGRLITSPDPQRALGLQEQDMEKLLARFQALAADNERQRLLEERAA